MKVVFDFLDSLSAGTVFWASAVLLGLVVVADRIVARWEGDR